MDAHLQPAVHQIISDVVNLVPTPEVSMPKQNAGSPRATASAPRENSKPSQPSQNLESQQQEARQDLPNVAELLLEPVPCRVRGQIRNVPWLEAYIRVTREKALQGDFQAGKVSGEGGRIVEALALG
jgi:hypothetical protein